MKKIKSILCLCLSISLLFTACTIQKNTRNQENTTNQESVDAQDTGSVNDTKQDLQGLMEIATRGCKIANEGEDIQLDAMTYRVNQVTLTKQQGDWTDISGAEVKLDSNKNIIGDATYVVVNVTVKKTADFDFWWNSLSLAYFTDDNLNIGPLELVSASLFQTFDPNDPKYNDVYQSDMKVGDEVTTDLIYVVNDDEVEENTHFLIDINLGGANLEDVKPDTYCMIYLASMEGVFDETATEK